MKLSQIMNLENEESKVPSFLNESLKDKNPVKVDYTPTWNQEGRSHFKIYKFKSRSSVKSFVSYILDYEINTGILLDIEITKENYVKILIKDFQLGNKLRRTLSKVDAIAKDTLESFRKYD